MILLRSFGYIFSDANNAGKVLIFFFFLLVRI